MRKINQWKDSYNHPFMPCCVKVSRLLSKNSYFEGICTRRVGAFCTFELFGYEVSQLLFNKNNRECWAKIGPKRKTSIQVMLEMWYIIFHQNGKTFILSK